MDLAMFPLEVALLPDQDLPLRIFEPRYVALVQHCVGSGDPFGSDFDLATLFAGDTFSAQANGFDVTNFDFDPSQGVLALAESAVPEPATWAMLLIGFGAIGWSLRRRTQTIRMFNKGASA